MILDVPDGNALAQCVDDCWNRIGTFGDGSCPRLPEHARCVNCPVFGQAAAALLDRPLDEADSARMPGDGAREGVTALTARDESAATHTVLAFRVIDEWLALPVAALRLVDMPRPVHPLPHRRNGGVLGLVNVRGTLTIAASLASMLSLDLGAMGRHASRTRRARTLVAEHGGETAAFPVDEVEGVIRFAADALMPAPATLTHSAAAHTQGILPWRDTAIGLLDLDRLFDSLARSLR